MRLRLPWWKLAVVGAAVALATVMVLVVGAGRVSDQVNPEIEQLRARIDDLTTENDRLLAAVDDLTAENDMLRNEIATILVLLEEVDGLGPRIRELRELQIRDLTGEDERDAGPPPDESGPSQPPDDSDETPGREPSREPEPSPDPSPSPSGGMLEELLPPDPAASSHTTARRQRAPPHCARRPLTVPA